MARAVVRVSLRPKQRSAPDRREGEMLAVMKPAVCTVDGVGGASLRGLARRRSSVGDPYAILGSRPGCFPSYLRLGL